MKVWDVQQPFLLCHTTLHGRTTQGKKYHDILLLSCQVKNDKVIMTSMTMSMRTGHCSQSDGVVTAPTMEPIVDAFRQLQDEKLAEGSEMTLHQKPSASTHAE